jgi:hypothetical protein
MSQLSQFLNRFELDLAEDQIDINSCTKNELLEKAFIKHKERLSEIAKPYGLGEVVALHAEKHPTWFKIICEHGQLAGCRLRPEENDFPGVFVEITWEQMKKEPGLWGVLRVLRATS